MFMCCFGLPATIVVMVSNVTIDFIIIVVTLITRFTSVFWLLWLREAPEMFRPVDVNYFVFVHKGRRLWFELYGITPVLVFRMSGAVC
jgi:hypothetical protein